ncbi:MAG: ATP synthase F1 subunit gamma [Parachlamydiaceae bacterium]|nr:ATP synthase F1 subunit gamma [Parachlamydiaceae bacterium]
MNTLRDIRRRLKSAENIKKITDAMERVAAARLRRAQELAENARPYAKKMKEMVEALALGSESQHPLFKNREVKNRALIIVSADKGLSGPYNSNILAAADSFLKKYPSNNTALILFGKKAIDYYQNKPWKINFKRPDWAGKIKLDEIQEFSTQLIEHFLAQKFDEVWLLYTHYVSVANREVILSKFLAIEKPLNELSEEKLNYIFEPSAAEIFPVLLSRYCAIRLREALYEAYASELAARIMAMQMASKNSEEMMGVLTRIRNKVRQEGITREMIEISSGVE